VWYKATAPNTNIPPTNSNYWTSNWSNSFGAAVGCPVIYSEASISIEGSPAVSLQLRAVIGPASLFPNAAAATDTLTLNMGTIDSYYFDSIDPSSLDTSAYKSAVLAAGNTLTIAGALAVKGYLAWPSPPAGINGNVTLNGIKYSTDKSRVSRSPFIPSFTIHGVPEGERISSNSSTTLGVAGSTTPAVYYYENSSSFFPTNLLLSSSSTVFTVAGPTILYVEGNLRIRGDPSARIRILPGGSLRLIVGGALRIDADGGGIENQTYDPSKCTILCTSSGSTDFRFLVPGSTNKFYGTIYVSRSDSTLTIGSGAEIFGAVSAKNVEFQDTVALHYDINLRTKSTDGVDQPYTVTEWRELPATERADMP
jgi:hypothetical protein